MDVIEAPTRDGLARLEIGPRRVLLSVGERTTLSVGEDLAVLTRTQRRRRSKSRSFRLDKTRMAVARAHPTDDIGIWIEVEPGVVDRVLGLKPPELLDDQALVALQALERLGRRLRAALAPHAQGVHSSLEVGGGADRVLIMDYRDHLVFYVRRLFRERAQRVMEVHQDGSVLLTSKAGDRRFRCTSRYGVTVIGDFIRFADPTGADLGSLAIPWITPEDRRYLVQLIGLIIDPELRQGAP